MYLQIIQDILERLVNIPEFQKFYKCEFDNESTSLKYYTTVSYPICLEAVIAKFQSHIYTTYESIYFDLQNIFRNAILFYGVYIYLFNISRINVIINRRVMKYVNYQNYYQNMLLCCGVNGCIKLNVIQINYQ